jgi:hypothetical protein
MPQAQAMASIAMRGKSRVRFMTEFGLSVGCMFVGNQAIWDSKVFPTMQRKGE